MSEKVVQRPPSRRERRENEDIQKLAESLEQAYLTARAVHGYDSEKTLRILDRVDRQWRAYIKKYKSRVDPDYLLTQLNSMHELEEAMAPIYEKVRQNKKFERWLNGQRYTNTWFWLWEILEKITGWFKKSFYKWKYEKVSL